MGAGTAQVAEDFSVVATCVFQGVSQHRQSNTDGQLPDAFKQGSYSSVNLLYYPVKNLMTGAELIWGKRENNNGASGDDSRVQFSAKYTF